MTYYQQQVVSIREKIFPKDHLCQQVMAAKQFIDNRFDDPIAVQDMAREAYFSKFHFLRLFKQVYGKTPYQYLIEIRIAKAKQLLQTDLPVSEVCFAVGFDSVSSFKRLFKRHTHFTPTAFRRQCRQQPLGQIPLRFLPYFLSLKKSNFQATQPTGNADLCTSTN